MNCTRDNVNFMSNYCLTNNFPEDSECFPYHSNTELYSDIAGAWCIFNAAIGFSGNLLTLLAIPYAAKHNKFSLDLHSPTTIFTLNLAFADFSYCAINLPLYAIQYLTSHWPGDFFSCQANAAFRYINAFAAWMSVAMIAVSRCATLTSPSVGKKILSGWSGLFFVILVWVYANALLLPIYSKWIGEFGYNCLYGKCDFIPLAHSTYEFHPRVVLYAIGFSIPGILTLTSYFIMGCYIFFNPQVSVLKRDGTSDLRRRINKRERRLAKALLAVCFCYFLFVMPITVMNILPHDPAENKEEEAVIYLAVFCLYWLQYSANFLIYAARCDQYRKAYLYFLQALKGCICGTSEWQTTTTFLIVNRQMLPTIFESLEPSLHQDMASAFMDSMSIHNQSCSNCVAESSAVIIVRRREKVSRRFGVTKQCESMEESYCVQNGNHINHKNQFMRIQSLKDLQNLSRVHSRRRSSL